jgi:hypothetical protein
MKRIRRGAVVRALIVTAFVAATALTVTAASPNVAAASQTDWSAPQNVDGSSLLTSVSCANPLFCAAVDESGDALTYNGSSWSPSQPIAEDTFYSVSCPSSTFCVTVGVEGTAEFWDGSSWNGPSPVSSDENNLLSVSCISSHFCVTVGEGGEADIWNGASWAGPTQVVPFEGGRLQSVSCTSATFCVAVDNSGDAYKYNGSTWSEPDNIDESETIDSVSCSSSTFCVALDEVGNGLIYDGSSWSITDIDSNHQLLSASCTSATFCVATDDVGNALTYNGSSWSTATIDDNALSGVSCTTHSFCAAVDDAGDALTYGWVSASYTCDLSGPGDTTVPILLSESPSAPPSITAPGTFSTTLSVDVTIPAATINAAITDGASSITIDSQSVEVDGLTTNGAPSGSVNPNTLTTNATNLPITFTPQSNTPYTYATTYNPETWQTVSNPGTVEFTPGDINSTFTYLIDDTPSPVSAACTPPVGVAPLDSTVVNPTSTTPSFQVPTSEPALQPQVSAPLDDGWAVTITNTSTTEVQGVFAEVVVRGGESVGFGGGGPVTFDFAGMADTGTSCGASTPGEAHCNVGTLAPGGSEKLNLLVETNGLAQGSSLRGVVVVRASNAPTQSASLGDVNVVVVTNGVAAVAVPTVSVQSSQSGLSDTGGKVTLTLPADVRAMGPFASNSVKVKGPPVAVTLQPIPGSQDPELCPPSTGGCEGDAVQVEGNFSAYTSSADPISAVIKVFYGSTPPAGSIYYQDAANDTPVLLPACVKSGGKYNTPCVYGAEKVIGASGNQSTVDTVFFTGADPLVGRR